MKVLVIGGGASGMAAALTAAQVPGAQVTLLERQARVGRKLLATGKGRCNLTNRHIESSHYHGAPPAFVRPALERFPMEETLRYFEALGLLTVEEPSGRVYPFSDQANSVVDVLRLALEAAGVEVVLGAEVLSLGKKARGYSAKTQETNYYGDKVILACGGMAGGKLGGTDLGYKLLESLGHRITPLKPALVQLRNETGPIRGLKGVRADAGIVLKRQGQTVAKGGGEVQFTDFGISGPAIFELSREITGHGETLLLDFLRPWDADTLRRHLLRRRDACPALPLEDFLTGTLHNRLGRMVLKQAGLSLGTPSGSLDEAAICEVLRLLKHFPLEVTGPMGFDQAQVTAGGADTSQFRADTLESRLCPGLFACGEVLDVDGDCGGYNLQWAWSSGRLAGLLGQKEDT